MVRLLFPLFLFISIPILEAMAPAIPASSRVNRKISISRDTFSVCDFSLNRDIPQPINLDGADVTTLHHGLFCRSFRYCERVIAVLSFCSRTSTLKSRTRNGVDLMMSGYKSEKMASLSVVEDDFMSMPAISDSSLIPEEELLREFSGTMKTLAVYSLGTPEPITIPTIAPMAQAIRINFRQFHNFFASSSKLISCSCTDCLTLSSFVILLIFKL